jgi:hypothetical protein
MRKTFGSILVTTLIGVGLVTAVPQAISAPTVGALSQPRILSAAWGLNNSASCPTGETGLDNIPVTLDWFIQVASVNNDIFTFTRSDGTKVHPTCSLMFPPNESNERQTVNLIGDFGDPAGIRPVRITIRAGLRGKPIGTRVWRNIDAGLTHTVTQLEAGPFVTDAWKLTPQQLVGDANQCPTGTASIRVVWSNGMAAYPTGAEVGPAVTNSYRAIFTKRNGKLIAVAPVAVADLNDHSSPAMADNMHDLCLATVPNHARLTAIRVGSELLQDPNGDPNLAQRFVVRRLGT